MSHLLRISRVTALLLFVIYGLYLFFQLYTHSEMFSDENDDDDEEEEKEEEEQQQQQQQGQQRPAGSYATVVQKSFAPHPQSPAGRIGQAVTVAVDVPAGGVHSHGFQATSVAEDGAAEAEEEEESEPVEAVSDNMKELGDLVAPSRGSHSSSVASSSSSHHPALSNGNGNSSNRRPQPIKEVEDESNSAQHSNNGDEAQEGGANTAEDEDEEDDSDLPQFTLASSIMLLVAVTLAVAVCSEYLVDSIEEVTQAWGMNVSFVGVILLPIVGNAAEHATAVTVAMRNKMDLSIGVAIGSSTQIALFLIPFVTLLGWIIDQPMSLNFSAFETISFLVAGQ